MSKEILNGIANENNPAEVRAHAAPWNRAIEFKVDKLIGPHPGVWYTGKLEMVEAELAGQLVVPTFVTTVQGAQTLMDDLWACGLRPTEGTGSAGALAFEFVTSPAAIVKGQIIQ